jgi:hypothetical protein
MNHGKHWLLALAALVLLPSSMTFAGDYFSLNATGSGGTNVNVTGSNVINLTDNLINQHPQFTGLAGQSVNASLSYGGVPNAIVFTENPSQTQATLSFPSTGFTQTFNGTSGADLQQQIKDFFKKNGLGAYAQFLGQMDKQSPLAAIDGNPLSSTAFIATDAFNNFGLDAPIADASGSGGGLKVDGAGGASRAANIDGNFFSLSLDNSVQFTDLVGLATATGFQYTDIGGSAAYTLAEEVGLPLTLVRSNQGLNWQVTPWGFAGISASYDRAAGTLLVGGGGTSSVVYRMGDTQLTLADQISYGTNVDVTTDGYDFNVPVRQWILKNGGRMRYAPAGQSLFVDAGITYTQFLRDAAVKTYWTPSAGVGIMFSGKAGLRISYEGDFATGYNVNGGAVTLFLVY